MIGERIVVIKEFNFNFNTYKKGHLFTIFGEEGMRGYNIVDDNGNKIYETALMFNEHFDFLKNVRLKKLNEIK